MESVISVNLVNFITIGLMALLFVFLLRFIVQKTGVKVPAAMAL